MVARLVSHLYAKAPSGLLYHYTGYQALLGIVESSELWASDLHYFNDSSELRHAADVLSGAASVVSTEGNFPVDLVEQLKGWLSQRLADGHMLFVTSFSEDGNLLSQWRGYTPHGNGVSLGFDPEFLMACASVQHFKLGQCIYDRGQQFSIAKQAVQALLFHSMSIGPAPTNESHPSQSYFPSFFEQEIALLSVAALFKHPAFAAEREWRAVSSVSPSYVTSPARYRAGRTTLIPYKPFALSPRAGDKLKLEQVFLGPTPENNLAMSALAKFLSASGVSPTGGIRASLLPYRET
jgi:hypothetical protein